MPSSEQRPRSSEEEHILESSGWPVSLFSDPAKQPTLIADAEQFFDELVFGDHLDDLVVFRDGLYKLDMFNTLPAQLRVAVDAADDVKTLLSNWSLAPHTGLSLQQLRGRIYTFEGDNGAEVELPRDCGGPRVVNLADKVQAIAKEGAGDKAWYLGELRRATKQQHPTGEMRKTVLTEAIKDQLTDEQRQAMLYWDCNNEGVFVGAAGVGSPLHTDQIQWSNVGKQWSGYKLMAIWPYGNASDKVTAAHPCELFSPPLTPEQARTLETATKVALVRPGDMVIFSGANAHMVTCVGPRLSITAYESFINMNPKHAAVFVDSCTTEHCRANNTDESLLDDIQDEIIERIEHCLASRAVSGCSESKVYGVLPRVMDQLVEDCYMKRQLQHKRQR